MTSLMNSQDMSKQFKYPPILCQLFIGSKKGFIVLLTQKWLLHTQNVPHFLCYHHIHIYIIQCIHSHEKPSNKAKNDKFALLLQVVDPKVGCSHREYLPISPDITLHGSTLMPSHKIFLPWNTLKELQTTQSCKGKYIFLVAQ